jgi:hypothetical protein
VEGERKRTSALSQYTHVLRAESCIQKRVGILF